MFEVPINDIAREAMKRAHEERSQVIRNAWQWLFPSATSR
jgi:hypothetical protein